MESLPDTRESMENSPAKLLIDIVLDAYNAGQMTLEEATKTFQEMTREAIE